MNKNIKEYIVRATTLLMCLVIICSNTSKIVYGQEDGDNSEKYTLTYPDGSSVSFSDYDTAKAEADKWKLLFSGKTDSDGLITLKGWYLALFLSRSSKATRRSAVTVRPASS